MCSGAAIIIGMSQVRYIVGYRVPRQDSVHEQIAVLIKGRAGFQWQVRDMTHRVGPLSYCWDLLKQSGAG